MGTRSLTKFFDENGDEIVVLYRQMDGYPSGHGLELANFLSQFTVVNGMRLDESCKIANGMGCLAALTISYFKGEAPGGFYLYPAGTKDCWEEYVYEIRSIEDETPHITILIPEYDSEYRVTGYKKIASGYAKEILERINSGEIE